jgi:DNA sulfur modification protein DndB
MALIVAKQGQFGNTTYWITTMKAIDVVNQLKIPAEIEGWTNLSPEERYQRMVNYKRVKDHMAPYLANSDDRFFGAFIVSIVGAEPEFEPLESAITGVPRAYKTALQSLGILHLDKGQMLVPLDGQHRLAALQFAITGKDEKQKELDNFTINPAVKEDDVTLILISHDNQRARKIFNKVNQYAKPTSKGDNLIVDDDNIVAVISRQLIKEFLPETHLVFLTTNTISKGNGSFTTLSTIYESTLDFLTHACNEGVKIDLNSLPSKEKQELFWEESKDLWAKMLKNFNPWKEALLERSTAGSLKRSELRESYVCLKPVIQKSIIAAIAEFIHDGKGNVERAIQQLNKINWDTENPDWKNVFFATNGRIISGPTDTNFATRFISYLIGAEVDEKKLLSDLSDRTPEKERKSLKLPQKV